MTSILRPALLLAFLVSFATAATACGAPQRASVAVNPISGNVFISHGSDLRSCDQTAQSCTSQKLAMKPTSAVVGSNGGLVFLTPSAIYRCDDAGQGCAETRLPISDAVALGAAPSGLIVVVSRSGAVALCDNAGCRHAAKPR